MLPGVIDSTLELVLASQLAENGVDCGVARRTQYLTGLPGGFRLLVDDAVGYEYSGDGAAVASVRTPTAVATTATTDAGPVPSGGGAI